MVCQVNFDTFKDIFQFAFGGCNDEYIEYQYTLWLRTLPQSSVDKILRKNLIDPALEKECGTCWGGGKIDIDEDTRTVDCWTCGGTGKI